MGSRTTTRRRFRPRSSARAAFLENDLPSDGAHGLAVFASERNGLFEALKLPRSVPNRVAIGHTPLVGPLARLARRERWCVALVNRRDARIFRGSPDDLREVEQIHDDVLGQHDQGGWSQARYQRGIEKEKDDHLKDTGDALMRHFKRQPFERLIVGGPREVVDRLRVEAPPLPPASGSPAASRWTWSTRARTRCSRPRGR